MWCYILVGRHAHKGRHTEPDEQRHTQTHKQTTHAKEGIVLIYRPQHAFGLGYFEHAKVRVVDTSATDTTPGWVAETTQVGCIHPPAACISRTPRHHVHNDWQVT